jgi:hypothetical protein
MVNWGIGEREGGGSFDSSTKLTAGKLRTGNRDFLSHEDAKTRRKISHRFHRFTQIFLSPQRTQGTQRFKNYKSLISQISQKNMGVINTFI